MASRKIYEYGGYFGNLSQLCRHFGKNYDLVKSRLKRNMSIEEAFSDKVERKPHTKTRGKQYTYKGMTGNLGYLCKQFGVDVKVVRSRLKLNHSLEIAMQKGSLLAIKNEKDRFTGEQYTYRGVTGNLGYVCRHFGISKGLVRRRLEKNIPFDIAMTPEGGKEMYTYKEVTGTVAHLCAEFNMSNSLVRKRLERGYSIEIAMYNGRLNGSVVDKIEKGYF